MFGPRNDDPATVQLARAESRAQDITPISSTTQTATEAIQWERQRAIDKDPIGRPLPFR